MCSFIFPSYCSETIGYLIRCTVSKNLAIHKVYCLLLFPYTVWVLTVSLHDILTCGVLWEQNTWHVCIHVYDWGVYIMLADILAHSMHPLLCMKTNIEVILVVYFCMILFHWSFFLISMCQLLGTGWCWHYNTFNRGKLLKQKICTYSLNNFLFTLWQTFRQK